MLFPRLDFNLWVESTILGNGMEAFRRYFPWMELKIRIKYARLPALRKISRLATVEWSVSSIFIEILVRCYNFVDILAGKGFFSLELSFSRDVFEIL
ncbi:hypothetical protein AVEN_46412-1 [Araneus ventricosus]|uniref:Uncharacterized protein n=1 Tax=Araneus ventricosus TaxID=182803 RepID=A0A4Y2I6H2_ARAVE|nr:hypothetical protein AVEN_46412-1 [Araneus ventricosus]